MSLSFRLAPSGAGWFVVDADGIEILITWPHTTVIGQALLEPIDLVTDSLILSPNGSDSWVLRDKHTRQTIVMNRADMQKAGQVLIHTPKPREDR